MFHFCYSGGRDTLLRQSLQNSHKSSLSKRLKARRNSNSSLFLVDREESTHEGQRHKQVCERGVRRPEKSSFRRTIRAIKHDV